MKKNNVIIFILVGVVSLFLLWLWYYLGLNHIDTPLDLLLSIIWWFMAGVAILVIMRAEKMRKERIRTLYVSDNEIYNSEVGKKEIDNPAELTEVILKVIDDLEYGFSSPDFPEKEKFFPRYLVRTFKIKDDEWEGVVINTQTKKETDFKNQKELTALLLRE